MSDFLINYFLILDLNSTLIWKKMGYMNISAFNLDYACSNGPVGRVFANGLRDMGSILGHVMPKTFKMVLDASLLNTQQYKVRIKGKVEHPEKRVAPLPYTSV